MKRPLIATGSAFESSPPDQGNGGDGGGGAATCAAAGGVGQLGGAFTRTRALGPQDHRWLRDRAPPVMTRGGGGGDGSTVPNSNPSLGGGGAACTDKCGSVALQPHLFIEGCGP